MEDNRNSGAAQERTALFVTTLTSFMGPFMISAVNVALPTIQSELQLNAVQLSWIATAYLLAAAVGLVPAGKIADIRGRKRVFTTGLAVYTVSATANAFADSATFLICLRVVQGFGAAMFVSTGMAILTSIFPPQKRGQVIGIYVAAVYVGLSMGPLVGGFLTESLGWRAIFFLILPLGTLSLWLTSRYLKGEWYGEEGQKLDITGCLLYAFAILSLVYGASRLQSGVGIFLVLTGAVLLLIFVLQQKRSRYPVFEVALFSANKVFTFSSFAALLNYSASYAVTFLISLYLQYIKGMSPQAAGSVLMAQPVVMALFSPFAGRLSDRIEPRLLATAGMTLTVIGVLLFSRVQPNTPLVLIVANLMLLGSGFALFSSPNMSAIMGAVEKHHYGLASGVVATMRVLGQMCSMTVVTLVFALFVGREAITPANFDQFLQSIHTVFMISACFCLCGIYFSWFRGSVLSAEKSAL